MGLYEKWGPIVALLVVVAVLSGIGMRYRLLPGDDTIPDGDALTDGRILMSLEMVYEDGSTRMVDPGAGFLSIMRPLAILDDTGKALEGINFLVKVKTDYKGTFYAGSIRGKIKTLVNGITKDTDDFDIQTDFGSGETVRVVTGGYTKYALRDWGRVGENELRILVEVTVEVIFENSESDSMAGTGGVVVSYKETSDAGITAISVTVTPTFLY